MITEGYEVFSGKYTEQLKRTMMVVAQMRENRNGNGRGYVGCQGQRRQRYRDDRDSGIIGTEETQENGDNGYEGSG